MLCLLFNVRDETEEGLCILSSLGHHDEVGCMFKRVPFAYGVGVI